MDKGGSPDFDKLMQNVMNNPEMLKSAFEMASKLSENGALSSLFAGMNKNQEEKGEGPALSGGQEGEEKEKSLACSAHKERRKDMARHRKLLEALELYVSEDKRDKLELVIRLLDLWELAGQFGS